MQSHGRYYRKLILDLGWMTGFLLSFFVFSAIFYGVVLREGSFLWSMFVTGSIVSVGSGIYRWLRD